MSAVPPFSAPATIHDGIDIADEPLSRHQAESLFRAEVKFTNEEMSRNSCRQVPSIVQMSLLKSCIQRHWKCWNLPAQNLKPEKAEPVPMPTATNRQNSGENYHVPDEFIEGLQIGLSRAESRNDEKLMEENAQKQSRSYFTAPGTSQKVLRFAMQRPANYLTEIETYLDKGSCRSP